LKEEDLEGIVVTMENFDRALEELEPAFGVAEDELKSMVHGDLIEYSAQLSQLLNTARVLIRQVRQSEHTASMSLLLEGESGSGATALAARMAMEAAFPYMKVISPENMVGMNEAQKCGQIAKVF